METEKVDMDVESFTDWHLRETLVEEGAITAALTPVAIDRHPRRDLRADRGANADSCCIRKRGASRKTGERRSAGKEGNLTGGWGAEVAARVADECAAYLEAPIRRLAAPDTPVPFAPVMENFYVPSVGGVVAAAEKLMEASR